MADQRLPSTAFWSSAFWSGAVCGVAAIWIAEELRRRRTAPRLRLVHDASRGRRAMALKRDEGAGDPAALLSTRAKSPGAFERSGGAPGGSAAPETHETPGRPGETVAHHDPAQPVRSALRTHVEPPGRQTNPS